MRKIWRRIKRLLFVIWFSNIIYTILLIWIDPPITPNMTISIFRNINTEHDFHHRNIRYDEMGTQIKYAVIASEDQKFAQHHGFDIDQIKNAIGGDRQRMRGASTITQQTAKNLFLINDRSYLRKMLEAYSTFLMELLMSKETILKHYLNIAEMGPNIYGISAAAEHYYGKKPDELTRSEACFIAALLPSPIRRSGEQKSIAQKKARWIATQIPYLQQDSATHKIVTGEQ